ncbi:MAG: hypothetical protein ACLQIQ_07540 [Beijerinckiaceae bacterium]
MTLKKENPATWGVAGSGNVSCLTASDTRVSTPPFPRFQALFELLAWFDRLRRVHDPAHVAVAILVAIGFAAFTMGARP